MDEPTSSLDEREVAVLFDVMRQLKAQGVAVIFVSHRLDELYAVCDRVTVMRDGRTVMTRRDGDDRQARARRQPCSAATSRRCAASATGFTAARDARPATTVLAAEGLQIGRTRARRRGFRCGAGEIVGLAGLLGSGRTETARAVFGADPADAGAIRLRRRDRLAARARPTRSRAASAIAPRTARPTASCPTCRCART